MEDGLWGRGFKESKHGDFRFHQFLFRYFGKSGKFPVLREKSDGKKKREEGVLFREAPAETCREFLKETRAASPLAESRQQTCCSYNDVILDND